MGGARSAQLHDAIGRQRVRCAVGGWGEGEVGRGCPFDNTKLTVLMMPSLCVSLLPLLSRFSPPFRTSQVAMFKGVNKGVPPAQFTAQAQTMVSMMSVKDLKKLITDAGLSHADCIEKADLRVRALETMVAVAVEAEGGRENVDTVAAARAAGESEGVGVHTVQRIADEISARFKRNARTADSAQMSQEMEEAVVAARAFEEICGRGKELTSRDFEKLTKDAALTRNALASNMKHFDDKFRTAVEGSLVRADASAQVTLALRY